MIQKITFLILFTIAFQVKSQEYTLKKVWETDTLFKVPESVAYDVSQKRLYVSSINAFIKNGESGNGFISIIDLNGNITNLKWITGLSAPTGIYVQSDSLYIVERDGISIYSTKTGKFISKTKIENPGFLNDVIVSKKKTIYFSDSSPKESESTQIGQIKKGVATILTKETVNNANGVLLDKKHLIFGNSGDQQLKKINLKTLEVTSIATFEKGILDGIKKYDKNHYLVSHWLGKLFLVSKEGKITELLNIENPKINIADFEYIKKLNLIVIPGFKSNTVFAYKISRN